MYQSIQYNIFRDLNSFMVSEPQTNVIAIISSSSSTIPQLSQVTIPNYNFPFILEQHNFTNWEAHILLAIIGRNLEGFVTGSIQTPSEFVSEQDPTDTTDPTKMVTIVNLDFLFWRRLD